MSEAETLWQKHDRLHTELGDLKVTTAVHEKILEQHTSQFIKINSDSGVRHGELVTKIGDVSKTMKELEVESLERSGPEKSNQYQIWVAFSLISILFTFVNSVLL